MQKGISKNVFPLILLLIFVISMFSTAVETESVYRGIKFKSNRFTGNVTRIYYPFYGWVSKKRLQMILERHSESEKLAREKMRQRLNMAYPDKPEQIENFKKTWDKIKLQDEDFWHLINIGNNS